MVRGNDPHGDLLASCFAGNLDAAEVALASIVKAAPAGIVAEREAFYDAYVSARRQEAPYHRAHWWLAVIGIPLVVGIFFLFMSTAFSGNFIGYPPIAIASVGAVALACMGRHLDYMRGRWAEVAAQANMLWGLAVQLRARQQAEESATPEPEVSRPSGIRARIGAAWARFRAG